MNLPVIDPAAIAWPWTWRPITEASSLFPSAIFPAASPLDELRREVREGHPLFGVECGALAYDAWTAKEFLFATDSGDMPFVVVHFTGRVQPEGIWPMTFPYPSLEDFLKSGRGAQNRPRPNEESAT